MAFDAKLGFFGFGLLQGQSEEEYLSSFLRAIRRRLDEMAGTDPATPVMTVRYEDLVSDLPGQALRLSRWLNVDLDPVAVLGRKMPYRQALVDDIWVDDPNADDYNRWVKKDVTHAKSYEKMKRDDNLYKYGIVIEYNTNPVIKGNGSAIFFHVWGGEGVTTEGCVAVSEEDIVKILAWLDPQASPIIIMGVEN